MTHRLLILGLGLMILALCAATLFAAHAADTYTAQPNASASPAVPATTLPAPIRDIPVFANTPATVPPSPPPVFSMPSFDALKKVEPMRHMQVVQPTVPAPPLSPQPAPKTADADPPNEQPATDKTVKPVGACRDHVSAHIASLTPSANLVMWEPLKDMLAGVNPDRVSIGLAAVEKNPGAVPPMGLYLAARALQDRGALRKATFYYYAGRLRAKVDILRWPSANDSPTRGSRRALNRLGEDVGKTLAPWAHDDADRLLQILRDVQEWDAKTPYDYHPGYRFGPRETPFAEWADRIKTARTDFAKECDDLVAALKTLGK